jgi:hypothetical protein
MSLEKFINSEPFTFGIELEIQLVNTHDYDLTKAASDLIRLIKDEKVPGEIKPEMTESMIELSTGVCTTHTQALADLRTLRDVLVAAADRLNIGLCGGGTHAFQQWNDRQIFDTPRFQYLSELYGYLAKQFTVFGQHVHIGCPDPDSALYLFHPSLHRLVGVFAICARGRHGLSFRPVEFCVCVPVVRSCAVCPDLGQLRGIFWEDGQYRGRGKHEGFLLGHSPETRFWHHRGARHGYAAVH